MTIVDRQGHVVTQGAFNHCMAALDEARGRANAKRTMDSHNAWKRMKPQPPDGTEKVQRIGSTDSFDCLGFGTDATNYVMLAVVHRPIGSTVRPVCEDGVWYWSNAEVRL